MCYSGCPHETYPNGYNETCVCKLPRAGCCPLSGDCDPLSETEPQFYKVFPLHNESTEDFVKRIEQAKQAYKPSQPDIG